MAKLCLLFSFVVWEEKIFIIVITFLKGILFKKLNVLNVLFPNGVPIFVS